MRQATFTEVRNHAKTYFDIVESGESRRVLRNGKPIADIRAGCRRSSFMETPQGPTLVPDGVSVSRMILEERDAGLWRVA